MEIARGDTARESAKLGDLDAIPSDIYIRYYRTLKEIAKDHMHELPSLTILKNLGIYGDAGTGKTSLADHILPSAYPKNCDKGWDGYDRQTGVIINDLDKYHVALAHDIKIGTEHRSFIAHTKGGAIRIRPECIIITS